MHRILAATCRFGRPARLARAVATFRTLLAAALLSLTPATLALATPTAAAPAPTADWSDAVIYFVVLDRFADGDTTNDQNVDAAAKGAFHGGDLKGLKAHLDDIADLGVTALWITPIVKNIDGYVTGAGFPDWAYHGYWADDVTRVDPRFGTETDLRAVTEECHQRTMRVLLDVVYNHVGYGSRYLSDPSTRPWLRSTETNTCGTDDETMCVAGLPDWKTELPEVAEYLYSAHIGLAQRVGLDGFRLDTVKHVSHSFWLEHRRRTRRLMGDRFFLLGEVWGGDPDVLDPWFSGDELDAGFDFSFQGNVLAFLQGRGRAIAFDRYLKSRERTRPGHYLAHFLSSHDVPTALWLLGGDKERYRLAAVLQFTSTGIPVIYYGEEVGRLGGEWPDNRSDMPWGNRPIRPGAGNARDDSLRADYKRLISIRRAHPALTRGRHVSLAADGDLLVFARRDSLSGDQVVVAINRGHDTATATVKAPEGWGPAEVRDAWNEAQVPVKDGLIEVALRAKSAAILVSR